MPIPPFAERFLIPAGANDPAIIPIGVILHVDAGNAESLYEFFRDRSGGIESHAHVRRDGTVQWFRDTGREADANYKANSFIGADGRRYGYISIETQGFGPGEWTDAQLDTIKRILLWAHEVHGIPLEVCTNPTDPGIGYHTLFGAPSAWTPVSKSCPGPDRIRQFRNVIVPWLATAAAEAAGPSQAEVRAQINTRIAKSKPSLRAALKKLTRAGAHASPDQPRAQDARKAARKIRAALDALKAKK
jgi:hypothetical protein